MAERLHLTPPSAFKQVLEIAGLRQVTPPDLVRSLETLDKLYQRYPQIAGDQTAIGPGDDGSCQSWQRDPRWWVELLTTEG